MLYTRRLKSILQSRYFFKIISVILVLYSIWISFFVSIDADCFQGEAEVTGIVSKYQVDGNKLTIYLKTQEKGIVTYYFETEASKKSMLSWLNLGDKIRVKGTFADAYNNTIPNGFNYKKYLKYHKIRYLIQAQSIVKQKNNVSVLYYLKNKITRRIDQLDQTGYLRTFILGDKSLLAEDALANYQTNGISHLFSISGMHVSLIVGAILFFLDKVSYNRYYKYGIIIPVLLFYLFLTDYSASITRTTIMFLVIAFKKCFNLKMKDIDVMLFVLAIAIILNPFILWDIGFQFSYSISLSLVLLRRKINKIKGKFLKNLYISFLCFIISFPLCVYYFYQVNFLSIFLNLIMIPFVSVVVFPLSLVTFLVPKLYGIYSFVIVVLERLNEFSSGIQIFEVIFKKPSIIVIFVYYIAIILSCYQKKYFLIVGVVMISHYFYPYLESYYSMTVLDVGQGDSIFIKMPHNQGNILIDTGGKVLGKQEEWQQRRRVSSVAIDSIIPYLKSLGIRKLDYLILTHGDYDHMGEAIRLVENYKVKKVIFNDGEYNVLENELIKVLDNKRIEYYKGLKELNVDRYKLQFLQTKLYDNENDNSNVIYLNYNNYKFLFMGDAGIDKESDILDKYNLTNIDFLKVGHHGSDTSSSEEFIDSINPKYSLISVGKNNRYGHPKKSVLETLSNTKIYRTDIEGSIEVKLNRNEYKIRIYIP